MMEIFKSVWTLFKKRRRTQEKEARLGTTSPTKMDDFLEIFLKGGRAAFSINKIKPQISCVPNVLLAINLWTNCKKEGGGPSIPKNHCICF